MPRTLITILSCTILAAGLLGFAPDPARARVPAPAVGEEDLFNLAHVFNHNFFAEQGVGRADQQGTDIEFFSAEVVVRDDAGFRVGPDGARLPEEAPDHVALRDFAVVGDHSDGIGLFDITDPESAYLASYITCPNPRADVGVFQWTEEDGDVRSFVGSSRESGSMCGEAGPTTSIRTTDANPLTDENGGISMFEVTDPYQPAPFARVAIGSGGSHNFAFHPTAPVAYAWNGEIGTAEVTSVQIVDMRPYFEEGQEVTEIFSYVGPTTLGSPHDGELSPDGSTMYIASENNYEIFDTADPFDPQPTTSFAPNPGTYAHGYFPTPDGSVAVTNNESLALGGFFVSGTSACPGEGLGFYDTSVPGVAVGPVGYYEPPVQGIGPDGRACTSHFGRVTENNVVMTVGWYVLGGRIVDFSDPTTPIEIGAATLEPTGAPTDVGTEAWSAKTYKGPYLYVGDQGRGFDIFRWTGPEECGSPFDASYDPECMRDSGLYRDVLDPQGTAQTVVLTPAVAAQAIARLDGDDVSWRFSCQI